MNAKQLNYLLEELVERYNQPAFIPDDPISVPHRYTEKPDIEIMGLFAAVLAWGQRKTIIRNCQLLEERMDFSPHSFILHHTDADLKPFRTFVHRTFNFTDLSYFFRFLQHHYRQHPSLENAFSDHLTPADEHTGPALTGFHRQFFSLPHPARTEKHIPTSLRKSACKRLNMYLRWMVRHDRKGVDFGIWKNIGTRQLLCPLDVHVHRVASELGLLKRSQSDWQSTLELTQNLRRFDAEDPVKYDFALFGLGLNWKTYFPGK